VLDHNRVRRNFTLLEGTLERRQQPPDGVGQQELVEVSERRRDIEDACRYLAKRSDVGERIWRRMSAGEVNLARVRVAEAKGRDSLHQLRPKPRRKT
jgi:hypothetical protein